VRPLVTILTVTYNHARFIGAALDSALAQQYRPLQIVVADDGSTDGTTAIVARYASTHADVITALTGRVGLLENANRALRAAEGEFVALLDGDDLYLPEKIERQIEWFSQSPDRVLCAHDVEHFFDDGSQPPYRHFSRSSPLSGKGPRLLLENGGPFATVSVMVRRSALPRYGFDVRMRAALDYKLWLDCLAGGGEFGYLPDVLARYRLHGGGFHRTRLAEIQTDLFLARTIFELEHPQFAGAAIRGRARQYYRMAIAAFDRGDLSSAARYSAAAIQTSGQAVPRAALLATLLHSPSPILDVVRRWRTRRRR
jgi:glycosyltransferase involved in cell wall biosynthesis